MHLSEITLVSEFINERAKGAFVNNIYRSNGGVLIKLYGADLEGIYFNTGEKVLFPVSSIKDYERQPITRIEEGLRANFTGRVKNVSVKKELGKVICIETINTDLFIPLFGKSLIYLTDKEGMVIWKENERMDLPKKMDQEMKYVEPASTDPFYYEQAFFNKRREAAESLKQQEFLKKRKKLEKLLKKLEEELSLKDRLEKENSENAAMIRNSLYLFDSNSKTDTVKVYNSAGDLVKVALEPKLTLVQNMEKLFKSVKKLKAGRTYLIKRIEEIKNELSQIKIEDITIKELAEKSGGKNRKQSKHVPYHRFETDKGRVFLVGKDAKDNDELTFKISSMHDLWFHAKDHSGSHVILKMRKNETVQAEDLLTGCVLALIYSKAKKDMSGEVWYTERKNLTKKKGMASGKVIMKKGRSKYIRDGKLSDKVKKID
jgi:predicted ribosome quality control (RQC) complex YloA/Tae2 family protein